MGKLIMTVLAIVGLTVASGSWVAAHSGARLIHADALGGRLQLVGAYMPAMSDARMLMVEACQGRFAYVEVRGTVEFRCQGSVAQQAAVGTEVAMAGIGDGL